EGGSARILSIDQNTRTIRFMPAGDPARGWPCWWSLRVDGAEAGVTLNFELLGSDRPIPQAGENLGRPLSSAWATPMRAAVSFDGESWQHTEIGEKRPGGMIWRVPATGARVWLAWGPPFTPHDSTTLVTRLSAAHPFAEAFTLARTREDREVSAVRIHAGSAPNADCFGVWVQARQHAWESGGSWVCRGFAEWLAGEDEAARWMREHAEIFIVPIMDVDHVATGDGGKEALPQDHNRDWSDAPHWPEVAAAQKRLAALAGEQRLDVFLDLHNPSATDLGTYFYTGEDTLLQDVGRRRRERFLALAREHFLGPIPYDPKTRASGMGYHPLWRQISNNWVSLHGQPHTLSLCLETAWNTPASTSEGYLATGRQLAAALAAYLREHPRTAKP
ncbi:MAG: M14 family zinc carboxypeptidase, partial [Chthoniobacter sp.]|uniref:M14 family zinc carboxypeptidase n=1 Tax=Chthoniobacter sp. TaxID=2510640 RepID=UPI0032AE78EE